jgi:hypothetical protein
MVQKYFFGYGSLVNRRTHSYARAHPAHLTGWRRTWRHTDLRPVAFLTSEPAAGSVIDGLIAHVPDDDWAALDEREFAYDRIPLPAAVLAHSVTTPLDVQIYAVPAGKHGAPTARHPILLSYLDAVVQGYLAEFGEDGARRFFDTTDGWDAPVLNDRHAPQYPRSQTLTKGETAFVDSALAATRKQG